MEITIESVFASRKARKNVGGVMPGAFQVSAKIDEESRKDNRLELSFLLTLSEPKTLVTYEFRGSCVVTGSPTDLDGMMEVPKGSESRLPRILDAIYQRVYPAVFMLAGLTSSSYPQSTTLAAESITGSATEHEETVAKIADGNGNGNGDARPAAARRPAHKAKRKIAEKPVEEKPVEVQPTTEAAPAGAPALPQEHQS